MNDAHILLDGRSSPRFFASKSLFRMLRKFWRGFREWSGDAAYERYLRSPRTRASASEALGPAEFYIEQLNRRYSRPNRCC